MATYNNLFYLGYLYYGLQFDSSNRVAKTKVNEWTGLYIVKKMQDEVNITQIGGTGNNTMKNW